MFKIEENALYSRADLAEGLAPMGVDVDHFIARLRPRKVFRMVWLGSDILKAFQTATPLSEQEDAPELSPPDTRGLRTKRRCGTDSNQPGAKLRAHYESLKERKP